MSGPAQSYEKYSGAKGPEWLLRIGDPAAAPILFIAPLFEEMNRTRALIVATMRALADGHCCWLPDLTGTGESLASLSDSSWDDWRHDVTNAAEHVAAAHGQAPLIAAIRGGCLLDDAAQGTGHWRFAPVPGASLARDLDRASLGGGAEWAGYHDTSPGLRQALATAVPAEVAALRTLRLSTDAGAADAKAEGPALWRRSEPGNSADLATALAKDIAEWRQTCAAS